jgi:hypothetical protein
MKRKLISYDVLKELKSRSLTTVENELREAKDVLATTLGLDDLDIYTFSESDVTYQSSDGNFIHATYKVTDDQVILENIQALIVEESSERNHARQTVSKMIDSLLENDSNSAESLFDSYMSMPFVKREMSVNEAVKAVSKSPLKGRKQSPATIAKRTRARNLSLSRMSPTDRKKLGRRKKGSFIAKNLKPKTMREWAAMCENVLGYLNYVNNGSVISESAVKSDDNGNVTALAVPTTEKRKQGKILTMDFKTMDTELKVLRGTMKNVSEDQTFIKAMTDLKRYNNISDNGSMEETLEAIVGHWPDLLLVSESELAEQIKNALTIAEATNFDDDTCFFMAEAILRTAHNAYTDRVKKIAHLAGYNRDVTSECKTCEDAYREFSHVSQKLFDQIDENHNNELVIFGDLYNALHEVYRIASHNGDQATTIEVSDFMRECYSIINNTSLPNMELAEAIANYLADILESSEEGGEKGWSHDVEVNATGEHEMTKWNAKQNGTPFSNGGNWKSPAPVSDGKSYNGSHASEMGHNSLGNYGKDTWPNVQNPFLPKSVMPKMKEKSVVDDDGLGFNSSGNTWPNLRNPLSLKSIKPKPVV